MQRKLYLRRIMKELDSYYEHHDPDVEIIPSDNLETNPEFTVRLYGPVNTPYYGAIFTITVNFKEDYPYHPPLITFNQPIYHPNISILYNTFCRIEGDDWKETWHPATTVEKLALSIKQLMYEANSDYFYNVDAARLYASDRDLYNRTVKEWCIGFGLPSKWRQALYIQWVRSHSNCILSKLPDSIVRNIIETYI